VPQAVPGKKRVPRFRIVIFCTFRFDSPAGVLVYFRERNSKGEDEEEYAANHGRMQARERSRTREPGSGRSRRAVAQVEAGRDATAEMTSEPRGGKGAITAPE